MPGADGAARLEGEVATRVAAGCVLLTGSPGDRAGFADTAARVGGPEAWARADATGAAAGAALGVEVGTVPRGGVGDGATTVAESTMGPTATHAVDASGFGGAAGVAAGAAGFAASETAAGAPFAGAAAATALGRGAAFGAGSGAGATETGCAVALPGLIAGGVVAEGCCGLPVPAAFGGARRGEGAVPAAAR
jgi:hypothetical protein